MRSNNPEAEKHLTALAVKISGPDTYKAIAPCIVYLPHSKITNVHGQLEPMSLHMCKPAKLVDMLSNRKENGGREWDVEAIWKNHCGIIFPHTPEAMFCARCFKEFSGELYKKLVIIQSAGKLKL